ncbi:MAG: PCP reductase family protein [Betaproteobacteria bacterium]|nr:PCP reductase family protein [Betaproteobacteria bacterium]
MKFTQAEGPREGSLSVLFHCPRCGHRVALLTNPWETQLVRSLGVAIGGRAVAPEPLELIRTTLATGVVLWTEEAQSRLERVPEIARPLARGSIERYARERGYREITPQVMDEARARLGF